MNKLIILALTLSISSPIASRAATLNASEPVTKVQLLRRVKLMLKTVCGPYSHTQSGEPLSVDILSGGRTLVGCSQKSEEGITLGERIDGCGAINTNPSQVINAHFSDLLGKRSITYFEYADFNNSKQCVSVSDLRDFIYEAIGSELTGYSQ